MKYDLKGTSSLPHSGRLTRSDFTNSHLQKDCITVCYCCKVDVCSGLYLRIGEIVSNMTQ